DLAPGADRAEALAEIWSSPSGLLGWFQPVNHKVIGKRYIATAFVFFLLGGIEALALRVQLAGPEQGWLGPDLYNQIFTLHGTTMMFLFAVPMMEGMGVYLVPLMIGTRDMAFPRLNAFGYYVFLIGGVCLYGAFFFGLGPDAGWFNYVPLAGPEYSPSHRIDFWATLITFVEVAALVAAVELIVTILRQRSPGMALHRMPLFVWAILVMSVMIVFAMPSVIVGSLMLALDRLVGTRFFDVAAGGDVVLWQHLFWFFGHPEVYIIFVPALGMVSAIVVNACRRPVFGYSALVLSLVATGFMAFGLWVHHMFAVGLPAMGESFFTAASMMIAIPTGVQIFCWTATVWLGRPRLDVPMLFVCGFVLTFVFGGLTGVMIASVPFDLQVHDTFFIVGHLHYVLIGGSVLPLFGALYYWLPKITGRRLHEGAGRWSFWLVFLGLNLTFFPMHQLGIEGMPRRIYTYPPEPGWGMLNGWATIGAFTLALGIAISLVNFLWSLGRGAAAGWNPWQADGLEWATASPPLPENFREIPCVRGRHPLWSLEQGAMGDEPASLPSTGGMCVDRREILVTSVLEATPRQREILPGASPWPFFLAVSASVAFVGSVYTPWAVVVGFLLAFVALVGWFWPEQAEPELDFDEVAGSPGSGRTRGRREREGSA
ncbi:MAG: cytochrome c oxidase subunit I, partial [bacterium]